MILELVAAALLGGLVLWILMSPLLADGARAPGGGLDSAGLEDALPVEETRRGQALLALKELDFDLATGKLSEADHAALRERFTAQALAVLREEERASPVARDEAEALVARRAAALDPGGAPRPACARCGPRPEPDAAFCSTCGELVTR
jgi:hypothetical protein